MWIVSNIGGLLKKTTNKYEYIMNLFDMIDLALILIKDSNTMILLWLGNNLYIPSLNKNLN